jgi:hypothetical protein
VILVVLLSPHLPHLFLGSLASWEYNRSILVLTRFLICHVLFAMKSWRGSLWFICVVSRSFWTDRSVEELFLVVDSFMLSWLSFHFCDFLSYPPCSFTWFFVVNFPFLTHFWFHRWWCRLPWKGERNKTTTHKITSRRRQWKKSQEALSCLEWFSFFLGYFSWCLFIPLWRPKSREREKERAQ